MEQAENEIRWIEMELEKVTPERRLREDGGDVTHWEKVSRAYRGSKRRKNVGELEVRAAIAPSRVS